MRSEELIIQPDNRKELIELTAREIAEKIDSGDVNPLLVLSNIKSWEKVFEKAKEAVIRGAIKEVAKHPEKKISLYGVEFEAIESGVSYDYKSCGHPEYNEICAEIDKLAAKKKEIEKTLATLKNRMVLVMEGTGEVVEVMPPVKKSTETIKTTIK